MDLIFKEPIRRGWIELGDVVDVNGVGPRKRCLLRVPVKRTRYRVTWLGETTQF